MSNSIKAFVRTAAASVTMASTVLGLGGFVAVTPVLAVAPADFGLTEGDVITATGDIDVYIVNDWGYKRLFVNPAIFGLYGHLSFGIVKPVAPAVRDAFGTSGLFRVDGDTKVYGLEAVSEDVACLHWVNMTGAAAAAEDANFFKKVFTINASEKALYCVGADYTSLSQVPDYSRWGASPTPSPTAGFNPNGGTQGSVDAISAGSPEESALLEGESNKEVLDAVFELADDGALLALSADVHVDMTGEISTKPWTYLDEVCVSLNGNELACKDAGSSSAWSDQGGDEYRMRFTSLNGVLPSGEDSDLTAEVSVKDTIDGTDLAADIDVWFGDVRTLDESGFTQTEDASGVTETFGVDIADVAAVEARDATEEIAAMVVEVGDAADTDGVLVYQFTLEETAGVDVDVNDLSINLFSSTGEVVRDMVKRVRILEGSTQRGSWESPLAADLDDADVLFENVGISLNGDQKKTFKIEVDLDDTNNQGRYQDGDMLQASVIAADFAAADANGNDEDDMGGLDVTGAVGADHTLRANGINVLLISNGAVKSFTADAAGEADQATYTIVFDVTAFGDDAYIDENLDDGVGFDFSGFAAESGASYDIDGAGSHANDVDGDEWFVQEGQTRRFTFTVVGTVADGDGGNNRVTLTGIDYRVDDGVATYAGTTNYTTNIDDFKTGIVNLIEFLP